MLDTQMESPKTNPYLALLNETLEQVNAKQSYKRSQKEFLALANTFANRKYGKSFQELEQDEIYIIMDEIVETLTAGDQKTKDDIDRDYANAARLTKKLRHDTPQPRQQNDEKVQ